LDQIPEDRWRKLAPIVFPELGKLWQARLDLYVRGAPIDPTPERIPAQFVTTQRSWRALSPQQQLQSMQWMMNQLSLAGDRAGLAAADKEAFINGVYKNTAGAIVVVGQLENSEALQAAGRTANAVSPSAQPQAIEQATAGVLTAAKAVAKFANLQPPPEAQTPAPGGPTTTTTRPAGGSGDGGN
jgi:hypothetical protein